MSALAPVSPRRRRTDLLARGLLAVGTLLALVPLVLVLYYVAKKGLGTWSWSFFTTDPTGNFLGSPGGIKSAILGTIEIVALATAIAVPLGIGVALYLVEYGRESRFAAVVRYFVDVMTGVPSIVFGLFIYITLILSGGVGHSLWADGRTRLRWGFPAGMYMPRGNPLVRVVCQGPPDGAGGVPRVVL